MIRMTYLWSPHYPSRNPIQSMTVHKNNRRRKNDLYRRRRGCLVTNQTKPQMTSKITWAVEATITFPNGSVSWGRPLFHRPPSWQEVLTTGKVPRGTLYKPQHVILTIDRTLGDHQKIKMAVGLLNSMKSLLVDIKKLSSYSNSRWDVITEIHRYLLQVGWRWC